MQDNTLGHNAKHRAQLIRKIYKELDRIEDQQALLALEKKDIKKRIVTDLNMKIADFNLGRRLYQLEAEHRDDVFDTIREAFEALGLGQQGDLFPRGPEPAPDEYEDVDEREDDDADNGPIGSEVIHPL